MSDQLITEKHFCTASGKKVVHVGNKIGYMYMTLYRTKMRHNFMYKGTLYLGNYLIIDNCVSSYQCANM